jgi:hypothetical protein
VRFEAGLDTDAHGPSPNSGPLDGGHRAAGDPRLGSGAPSLSNLPISTGIRRFPKWVPSENGLTIRSGFSRISVRLMLHGHNEWDFPEPAFELRQFRLKPCKLCQKPEPMATLLRAVASSGNIHEECARRSIRWVNVRTKSSSWGAPYSRSLIPRAPAPPAQ